MPAALLRGECGSSAGAFSSRRAAAIPHDRLVTRFGLGQFRDGLVACVMQPKPFEGTLEVAGIGAALGTRFSRILERVAPLALNRPFLGVSSPLHSWV